MVDRFVGWVIELVTTRSFAKSQVIPCATLSASLRSWINVQYDTMLPRRPSLSGLFLALLALAAQFVVAAAMPQGVSAAEPVNHGGRLICYDDTGDDADTGIPAPTHRHDPSECAVCPLCLSLASQSATLMSAGPVLPMPSSVLIARAAKLPPILAPPAAFRRSAQPRAPPFPA